MTSEEWKMLFERYDLSTRVWTLLESSFPRDSIRLYFSRMRTILLIQKDLFFNLAVHIVKVLFYLIPRESTDSFLAFPWEDPSEDPLIPGSARVGITPEL